MILPIHKKAIDLWINAKHQNESVNPTTLIYSELTGKTSEKYPQAQDIIDLCEGINEILYHPKLSEQDKIELQKYGIRVFQDFEGSASTYFTLWNLIKLLTISINVLAVISIVVGGLNWWVIGLAIATWWAKGATKLAIQKKTIDPGPRWELPMHYFIHLILTVFLLILSIKNLI